MVLSNGQLMKEQAMIKKQKFFLTSAFLVIGSTFGGCVTSSSNKADLTGESGLMPKGAGAHRAVVSQIGAKDPMLAPYPRSYWLDQRQAKALMPRARGALATGDATEVVALAMRWRHIMRPCSNKSSPVTPLL